MKNRSATLIVVILVATISAETYAYANLNSSHNALTLEKRALEQQFDDLNASYDSLSSSYRSLESTYSELSENLSRLSERHRTLQLDYASLESKHSDLKEQYSSLESDHESLQSSFQDLQSQRAALLSNYTALEADYQTLESEHKSLEEESSTLGAANANLRQLYNELEEEHSELEEEFDGYVRSYLSLVSKVNLHGWPSSDAKKLITPLDSAIASKVQEITGGWSDPPDWNEFWTDVKALYDWVVNNIGYRYDGLYPTLPSDPSFTVSFTEEMWQFPNQTLDWGNGDCEDMSVLLASMIAYYNGGRYFVECMMITRHVAVYIPVAGGEICILDPAGHYYTSTGPPFQRIRSKDIKTEVDTWLSKWDSSYPEQAPHRVEAVFSTNLWQQFNSTEEFVDWLYSR